MGFGIIRESFKIKSKQKKDNFFLKLVGNFLKYNLKKDYNNDFPPVKKIQTRMQMFWVQGYFKPLKHSLQNAGI